MCTTSYKHCVLTNVEIINDAYYVTIIGNYYNYFSYGRYIPFKKFNGIKHLPIRFFIHKNDWNSSIQRTIIYDSVNNTEICTDYIHQHDFKTKERIIVDKITTKKCFMLDKIRRNFDEIRNYVTDNSNNHYSRFLSLDDVQWCYDNGYDYKYNQKKYDLEYIREHLLKIVNCKFVDVLMLIDKYKLNRQLAYILFISADITTEEFLYMFGELGETNIIMLQDEDKYNSYMYSVEI